MLNQQSPSLGAIIAEAIEARLIDVHTHLPGRIESYDATTQKCSVQIDLRQARFLEDGSRVADKLPVLNNVPVAFGRGGGFRTTYPLRRGDVVWVGFCEGSLDRWKQRGGDIDPSDDRRCDLSDGVVIAGIADFGHPLANAPTDRMSLGCDAGATIEITSSEVRVGGNTGTQPTHKGTSYNSAVNSYVTSLSTFLAAIVAALPVPAAVAGPAATYATAVATFSAAASASLTTIAKVL